MDKFYYRQALFDCIVFVICNTDFQQSNLPVYKLAKGREDKRRKGLLNLSATPFKKVRNKLALNPAQNLDITLQILIHFILCIHFFACWSFTWSDSQAVFNCQSISVTDGLLEKGTKTAIIPIS
jgi:hypothetical protein